MRIQSPLVILNACNTGTGKLQAGEGIMSMARGFQYAGVPTIITTLWPIDDRSSATIMKFFFENIRTGMDQGQAMQKARNSYLDQASKATGAPFFWAAHVLIGDPGEIPIRHYISRPLWIIILCCSLLGFGLLYIFFKKRR